jgi:branched-chain amino acid transport system substrate-binding protein
LFLLGLGFGGYWLLFHPPQIFIVGPTPPIPTPIPSPQNLINTGERVLISEKLTAEKQSGVEAFAKGNWNEAIAKFQASLLQNPNDPEARIYLNNAKIGNSKALKIAVSVPICSCSSPRRSKQ